MYEQYEIASIERAIASGSVEMIETVKNFWKSPLRKLEYLNTRQFFNKIGAGPNVFAAGIKE
jgi:hypothetical protein